MYTVYTLSFVFSVLYALLKDPFTHATLIRMYRYLVHMTTPS